MKKIVLCFIFLVSCGLETSTDLEVATVRTPIIPGSFVGKVSKKVLNIQLYHKINQKVGHVISLYGPKMSKKQALNYLVKNKLITQKEKKFFSSQNHKLMEDKVKDYYSVIPHP